MQKYIDLYKKYNTLVNNLADYQPNGKKYHKCLNNFNSLISF